MSVGLYSGVSAMEVAQKRLDVLAGNLANVGTAGYRRRTTAAHAFQIVGDHQAIETKSRTDFRQGPLDRTGNPFDLALMGSGFFAVDGPEGEIYTRNGSFILDDAGTLKTIEGYPVAWERSSGRLDPVGQEVRVDGAGNVFQGKNSIGQVRVVDFEDPQELVIGGLGYFHPLPGARETATDAEVHQFSIEGSNVSGIDELIGLITVQRSFESASNMMRQIDQTYRRLFRAR